MDKSDGLREGARASAATAAEDASDATNPEDGMSTKKRAPRKSGKSAAKSTTSPKAAEAEATGTEAAGSEAPDAAEAAQGVGAGATSNGPSQAGAGQAGAGQAGTGRTFAGQAGGGQAGPRPGFGAGPGPGTGQGPTAAGAAGERDPEAVAKAEENMRVVGQAVWLMSNTGTHKHLFFSDMEWAVLPPIALGQYRIWARGGFPVGFATWALSLIHISEPTRPY